MKTTIIASALLAATAAAQPRNHARGHAAGNGGHKNAHRHLAERRLVTATEWLTVYQTVTEVVDVSSTWLVTGNVDLAMPTATVDSSSSETTTSVESETTSTALPTSSTSSFVEEDFTSTTEQPVNTPPPSSSAAAPPPPPQSSSSVYVPPPPPPPQSSTSIYVPPPPPPPTSSYVPPPAPSPSPPAPVYQPPPSSGGGGGGDHSGDITFYTIGMGSCGEDNSGQDSTAHVVALSHVDMNMQAYANPNANPNCGKKINITVGGKTAEATVVDTCMGCDPGSIDVSEALFIELIGDLGVGRTTCSWSFS